MLMINGQNIKKYHGAQLVLADVAFEIHEGERIGLVGRNGSGKSTLLRLISKMEKPDEGLLTVRKDTRIGYLAQIPTEWESGTVYDVLAASFAELLECRAAMTELEQRMSESAADGQLDQLLGRYAQLQERFEREGGYELDARIDQVATGLRIAREVYERSFASLSGGEKTKIALASQLIGKPDVLLLDEPTNHLDLFGVEWLEEYLTHYEGACFIVSHDRYFLDRVVTKIVELEDGESSTYLTSYTGYMKEKEVRLLQQFADYQEQQKVIKKMKETIKQLMEWGRIGGNDKFFRRAASMQKALDRMEKLKRPVLDPKAAEFGLKVDDRSGKRVIVFDDVSKQYGDKVLLRKASGLLEYGEKVMLLGHNGSGKTTLLKMLLGEVQPDGGDLQIGARVDIGYLAQQEYPEDQKKTVLAYFCEEAKLEEGEARSRLAAYLFYGADVFKPVSSLSGGEWTRLRLALLVLRKPNLLILDEPTNHMDIASREALEEALEEFPGTVLAVTHDRYFINRLSQKIWELDQGRITVYLGSFDAYKAKSAQLRAAQARKANAAPVTKSARGGSPAAATKAEPRAASVPRGSSRSSAAFARERLERGIAEAEARLGVLDQALENPAPEELSRLWAEREAAQGDLDQLYAEWIQLEE
ncbi:ABC-F family ATP-binding cassette domain-containing protein [Paenibacillus chondroitinus]|uniref:ABC-F family ATP-binding cassette domain-containing protein n=1 Tax=Paenibacillus chondroitinus TaxID=59842 RepID=A0ABU6DJR5_9BACL|nr:MULTISPECIES: ABC-F family ATP-binding cassette domain-containing protein [Paenibacillus]MCY9657688.1 ABC-F family ATP-binding cassette domain-containing protein [Paenibacillus anseongense]MEB4798013.1 ABC-F family ATP-binding cassette domain-containing protein [Paenibacillus chondroitinus]